MVPLKQPYVEAQDENMTVNISSQDHRSLLDVIDKLRLQGIGRYVDLPQIVVCGDQSSGKSSVLEAISGMSFPTKDNLCTRFATELILRRSSEETVKVTIVAGHGRSDEEKSRLESFSFTTADPALDLEKVVERAKAAMGLDDTATGKVFCTDILRVEISGAAQPHLTMVDLPGLFEAGSRNQSEQDAEVVKSLVLSYMKRQRTIILAVVSAKSDFNVQSVTKHARRLDPKGERTLGLITKPDTLDKGSDSEQAYMRLASNEDVFFHLGWHVVRNRDYSTRDMTLPERNQQESEFFSRGAWAFHEPSRLGIFNLRDRLSTVLKNLILRQIPLVLKECEESIASAEESLRKLGPSRSSAEQQRQYLHQVRQDYFNLVRMAVDGSYSDRFFNNFPSRNHHRCLRAAVQNTLLQFARKMQEDGHFWNIVDEPEALSGAKGCTITRGHYVEHVKKVVAQTRGRELPGTYNPLTVEDLFKEQSQNWKEIIDKHVEKVIQISYSQVTEIINYVADELTANRLLKRMSKSMQTLREVTIEKTREIYHRVGHSHPITYNHYFTENIRKSQQKRQEEEIRLALMPYTKNGLLKAERDVSYYTLDTIIQALTSAKRDSDMDTHASEEATRAMEAYYKVALKQIIDDVASLVLEQPFLQRLTSLLDINFICSLTDADTKWIAGENDASVAERLRLQEKISVLRNGIVELRGMSEQVQSMSSSPYLDDDNVDERDDNQDAEQEDVDSITANGQAPRTATAPPSESLFVTNAAALPLAVEEQTQLSQEESEDWFPTRLIKKKSKR